MTAVVTISFQRPLHPKRRGRLQGGDFLNTKKCARARTSVNLAGKRDSRRHSTTKISENVVVVETSYQMLKFYQVLRSGEGLTSSTEDNSANLSGEKKIQ